jgi:putative ABC transport system permease protein
MALCVYPNAFEYLLVRIDGRDPQATIGLLKERWTRLFPNISFTYTFFDDHFGRIYQSEARLGNTLNLLSLLALVIACLGLFALFSFTTGQRTKEIGIRRVMGCSTTRIVILLTRDLVYTILLASALAWPVTHLIMTRWLQNFAYHTKIGLSIFLSSVLVCLLVALGTISLQVIQKANTNPVDTLRYE